MATYRTTVEVDVIVHYEAVPESKGTPDGKYGPPLEPTIPAHIDVDYIELNTSPTQVVFVSREQMNGIRDEIAEYEAEQSQPQED